MNQTVVGVFQHMEDAEKAVRNLENMGISRSNIDVSKRSAEESSASTDRDSENGITRFFKSLFGDGDDADRYSRMGNSGYSVVTVHASTVSDAERAAEILDEYGAVDVDEDSHSTHSGMNAGNTRTGEDSDTVSRVSEELNVGKREVESGKVRVRSRIVEKPVEESVRLREEHIQIDRQAVNRPLTDSDQSAFRDQDIELTERAEVPVVNKEARVVEEIRISKTVSEHDQVVKDTVRNSEIDIDRSDDDADDFSDRRNTGDNQNIR